MTQTARFHHPAIAPHGRGPAFGWGISVLVHALAVAWVWHTWSSRPAETDTRAVERIEVRLVPAVPEAMEPAPVPSAAIPRSQPTETIVARKPAHPADPPTAIVMPPAPGASPAPAATDTPIQAPASDPAESAATATDTPTINLASARAAARLIARENPRGLVALPERKPVVDANADHHVVDRLERARRVDCQTARAESTNLLANVVMLAVDLTKNAIEDNGCKWQ